MLISTKGRYALRILIDLAENEGASFVPLRDIAKRQEISPKYMERIMAILIKGKLVEGQHGKNGGYRLSKAPADYRIGEVLRLTEESLAPVACLKEDADPCLRSSYCRTLSLWKGLNDVVCEYLDSHTLEDLLQSDGGDYYVI